LQKEQLISSLEHRLKTAEDESERHETAFKDLKTRAEEGEGHRTTGENLTRKVQMLEEELERNEKELKEVNEK
jgi:tropomyosin